jgi:hypothetical protein
MDPNQRDPGFGRFAFTVITIALVVITLGLTAIYYYFQAGGSTADSSPLSGFFKGNRLPPNQANLYFTKDGRQLVGNPVNLGSSSLNHSEKATRIMENLLSDQAAAGLKSPLPQGTRLINLFVNNDQVIVNLSKEMMVNLNGGIDTELLAVYSVVNSLLFNLEGIDAVQILIEGEKVPTLRGHDDISVPLIANTAITRVS